MLNRTSFFVAALVCVLAPACSSGSSNGDDDGSAALGGGSNAQGGGSAQGATGSFLHGGSSSAGNANASGGLDPADVCVAQSAEGERLPVDLYFMVDTTGSMNCPVPDSTTNPCEVDPGKPYAATTRWVVESAALRDFISQPRNAGLGMGLDFFPASSNACDAKSYSTPLVEIAVLPDAASALTAAINKVQPNGNTPTVASLTGAIQHATAWAKKSGHRAAVVYSTDGYPKGCDSTNTIDNAVAEAAKGLAQDPSIATYVLGVGQNLASLDSIAKAGGTDQAYLIDTNKDAGAQLSAAFDSIRGKTQVSCEYTVPPPPAGQTLDPMKVNVHFEGGDGKDTAILKDASASSCTEGWQYSPDKTKILLCGNACELVKSDLQGTLQIQFGCATVVDIPR